MRGRACVIAHARRLLRVTARMGVGLRVCVKGRYEGLHARLYAGARRRECAGAGLRV